MNWTEILGQIFQVCIIPLLGVLTGYLINFIKKKADELKNGHHNELVWKYTDLVETLVVDSIKTTNQTYVEALKDKNAFTKEAQEEALKKTYERVMSLLNDEGKAILNETFSDVKVYVKNLIESKIDELKKTKEG